MNVKKLRITLALRQVPTVARALTAAIVAKI
jgi:hypothetical protein